MSSSSLCSLHIPRVLWLASWWWGQCVLPCHTTRSSREQNLKPLFLLLCSCAWWLMCFSYPKALVGFCCFGMRIHHGIILQFFFQHWFWWAVKVTRKTLLNIIRRSVCWINKSKSDHPLQTSLNHTKLLFVVPDHPHMHPSLMSELQSPSHASTSLLFQL